MKLKTCDSMNRQGMKGRYHLDYVVGVCLSSYLGICLRFTNVLLASIIVSWTFVLFVHLSFFGSVL
jgi:hypothetical protein